MVDTSLIQTFLVNGSIMLLFLFFGFKILTRHFTRKTVTLSFVFIIPAIGLLINILYRIFNNSEFNIIGNIITIVMTCFGLGFLYSFDMMLSKSEKTYTLFKQIMTHLLYLVLLCGLFFIPNGVTWDYTNNIRGVPVWSVYFCIYGLTFSQLMVFLILYFGLKLYSQMGGKKSKYSKKFINTIIGIILLDIVIVGNFIFNTLNEPLGRTILLILSVCIIPSAIFLYVGLKTEKKKQTPEKVE
ncbi:MAG: hypothetical protein ACTSVU_08780 [Promethearchaeota archaeon]